MCFIPLCEIVHFTSIHQVEINNSDAEGRLVLSDAVAHATRHYADDCDLVVDMATLTGAQLISTGKMHGAALANTEALERQAVRAGLASGDLVYPLLYAPELLKKEFKSKVRRSVSIRTYPSRIADWNNGDAPRFLRWPI